MHAWSTLAALVVVTVVVVAAAVHAEASAAAQPSPSGRRRWSSTEDSRSRLNDVLRAKIEELEKLGVTSDEVVRYIWRMRQGDPGQPTAVAAAALPNWPQNSASTDQRLLSDRNLLVRNFIRNRTVGCNDGSPAGYLHSWLLRCARFVNIRNLQHALRSIKIAHAQFTDL